jgi:predicted aldo/keto reductase-like oxidoreductase
MNVSRRQFLEVTALGCATTLGGFVVHPFGASSKIPTREFGRTGEKVSILAFGAGSRFLEYEPADKALEVLNHAIDLGITYIDTAHSYGDGKSEERVGKVLLTRRKEVMLATKIEARKADEAMRQIELSLKRLQTDHVDVLHIHSLAGPDDLAAIEAPDGVLKAVYKAREQKMARFLGITSHTDPAVLKTALERHDFNCVQMALNAGLTRMDFDSPEKALPMPQGNFETVALPVANRKKLGVIAMKIFGQEKLLGKAPVEKLLYYSMSLPISTAVVGMPKEGQIEQNVALARGFKPLSETERRQLSNSIAVEHKVALEYFFRNHIDA